MFFKEVKQDLKLMVVALCAHRLITLNPHFIIATTPHIEDI